MTDDRNLEQALDDDAMAAAQGGAQEIGREAEILKNSAPGILKNSAPGEHVNP